jgi:hypothetical protein
MSIIKPTVGRVLWYWPSTQDIEAGMFAYPGSDQPFTAQVVFVHSDRMVNLIITDHGGGAHEKRSVTLLQAGDSVRDNAGYAEWMPYQQGQAAKSEAAEAKACSGCGSCAASDPRVRLFLNRGAVIKVNGVPLELEHDTTVLAHAANVPLLSSESVAACQSERAD